MKNKEIVELFTRLDNAGKIKGSKLAVVIARNLAALKDEVETIKGALIFSDNYKEFERKRFETAQYYAEKDDDGQPKSENGRFIIQKDVQKDFDEAIEELKKEYEGVMEEYEKTLKDYEEFLNKENECELIKIKVLDLPQDITAQEVYPLLPIIE